MRGRSGGGGCSSSSSSSRRRWWPTLHLLLARGAAAQEVGKRAAVGGELPAPTAAIRGELPRQRAAGRGREARSAAGFAAERPCGACELQPRLGQHAAQLRSTPRHASSPPPHTHPAARRQHRRARDQVPPGARADVHPLRSALFAENRAIFIFFVIIIWAPTCARPTAMGGGGASASTSSQSLAQAAGLWQRPYADAFKYAARKRARAPKIPAAAAAAHPRSPPPARRAWPRTARGWRRLDLAFARLLDRPSVCAVTAARRCLHTD